MESSLKEEHNVKEMENRRDNKIGPLRGRDLRIGGLEIEKRKQKGGYQETTKEMSLELEDMNFYI